MPKRYDGWIMLKYARSTPHPLGKCCLGNASGYPQPLYISPYREPHVGAMAGYENYQALRQARSEVFRAGPSHFNSSIVFSRNTRRVGSL
jgi:hypothetical protein